MRRGVLLLGMFALLMGCASGTAQQELQQLRSRVSTLEAETAHLLGQKSLLETERDQLRSQVNSMATELAKLQATQDVAAGAVVLSENLVVLPKEVRAGQWVAVYVRNYPLRLLPHAGVALRGDTDKNLAHIRQLAQANVFLLPIPPSLSPGNYHIVLGEAGTLGPGAKIDDQVPIVIK